ncbi:MAG: hypothetical protein C0475_03910 [Planctomyces sp.]|nr:hypothetical protein [Planctomyces sp.]MBA4039414.1 hypothetical protein [Planctomyces sp.]
MDQSQTHSPPPLTEAQAPVPGRASQGPPKGTGENLTATSRPLRLIRAVFLVVYAVVAVVITLDPLRVEPSAEFEFWYRLGWKVTVGAAMLMGGAVIALEYFSPLRRLSTLFAVLIGVASGLVASLVLYAIMWLVFDLYQIDQPKLLTAIVVFFGMAVCYMAISVVLQTRDDFRLVIPYIEFARQVRGPKPIVVDTSSLIDARLAELMGTGIVQVPLVVPGFVMAELHAMADSADRLKRSKGRRGLEVIGRLQRVPGVEVRIDHAAAAGTGVDQMLVGLARAMPALLLTTDTGLARVAAIQGVSVLNLNDVAAALRPGLVPGSRVSLELIKPGEHAGQAVGYLDDGTMVVVEHAAERLGQRVEAEIANSVQTQTGRLLFARLGGAEAIAKPAPAPFAQGEPTHDAPSATDAPLGATHAGGADPAPEPAGPAELRDAPTEIGGQPTPPPPPTPPPLQAAPSTGISEPGPTRGRPLQAGPRVRREGGLGGGTGRNPRRGP